MHESYLTRINGKEGRSEVQKHFVLHEEEKWYATLQKKQFEYIQIGTMGVREASHVDLVELPTERNEAFKRMVQKSGIGEGEGPT
ncbi:unnamed protein product [Sphenostylis stenocarpa]|uniref:Uncharacterized protein n=1 Tax=Sphenostylis stenocarpa TaxID=92480 RepID=A0AA86V9K7_9FABA|nr:unnamed protein product [Sphenostylis stenocarpa]